MESQKTITDAVNDVLKVTQEDDGGDEPKVAVHHSHSSSAEAYPAPAAFASAAYHPAYDGYHGYSYPVEHHHVYESPYAYGPPPPAPVYSAPVEPPVYSAPVEHHTVHHHHHAEPEEKEEPEVVVKKERTPTVVMEKETPSKVIVRDPTPAPTSSSPNSSVMRAIAAANE